jgi:hypothetical protein
VISASGQIPLAIPLKNGAGQADLSTLPNGTYLIQAGDVTKKVIVQH